jgi:hypothetical protein
VAVTGREEAGVSVNWLVTFIWDGGSDWDDDSEPDAEPEPDSEPDADDDGEVSLEAGSVGDADVG